MKLARIIVTFWCLALIASHADGDLVTWTNRQGQSMSARFVSLEGDTITFKKENGQKFTYSALELNLDGQNLVRKLSQEAASQAIPPMMRSRCSAAARKQAIENGGGVPETEAAISKSLGWLSRQQDAATGAIGEKFTVGMTGLSLLAFLGHCETPESPKWGDTIVNGAVYLMDRSMQNDGLMSNGESGGHVSYEHAIATQALAELYLITKDSGRQIPKLEKVLAKAVDIIVDGQTRMGGWAYGYADNDAGSDMSLSAWQLQALRAALQSGQDSSKVEKSLDKAVSYLKKIQDEKGAFKYRPDDPAGKITLTGAAVHSLFVSGEKNSPEYASGMAYLSEKYSNPATGTTLYAPYYNTLAFFTRGGEEWRIYRDKFMPKLLAAQDSNGAFFTSQTGIGREDRVLMNTAWAVLILEVYYRYPIEPDNLPRN